MRVSEVQACPHRPVAPRARCAPIGRLRRAVAGLVAVAAAGTVWAQAMQATPDQVKAAYLHKFAAYVEWPSGTFADSAAPVVVGVVNAQAVHAEMTRLIEGRPVQGRPMVVRPVAAERAQEGVHILYVGSDTPGSAQKILPLYRDRPVLTVTDAPDGIADGAVLGFVLDAQRVRFQASLPAAHRAGLTLSSRLLAVADRVVGVQP